MPSLVLLRHGQSIWNQERRFTGWDDVELSRQGCAEAETAGRLLCRAGCVFDICFTSVLQRAQKTLEIALGVLGQTELPIHSNWRLNERHYGALQGLEREEVAERYGAKQVNVWQQDYAVRPPALEAHDPRFPGNMELYASLSAIDAPYAESIKDVRARVLPYWYETIYPSVEAGKRVLVVAHGNSLRALTTYLDSVIESDIAAIKRPLTGEPFVYELDDYGKSQRHYYLRKAPKIRRWAKSRMHAGLNSIRRF